ncbi:MAG TPA: assimilatory sulfite reductase (NADPH) flavoprotein subunit [Prolixibacteraceae bacterium]|nr:assimilatory sulfite reductase (NADPH) flavoprotein subunit [Prolixibacteraceae bacterium]
MTLKSNPLNEKQIKALNELATGVTPEQIIWLSGYFEGRMAGLTASNGSTEIPDSVGETITEPEILTNLTILYGSETGHSQALAEKLAEKAAFKNIATKVSDMYEYNYKKLAEEENVAIIVSTHGEGEPPDMAEDFYKYITGKRAPNLENLNFSVLALGDKSYKHFCKTGEDIYRACKDCGAFSITSLVKCDVDYEMDSEIWMNNFLMNLEPATPVNTTATAATPETDEEEIQSYSKKNPYLATVLEKVKITGKGSDKEVYHIELALDDSGLTYEPGDSVGIFAKNPASLVAKILQFTGFDPDTQLDLDVGEVSLKDALDHHLEITIITYDTLKKYYEITKNPQVEKLLNDDKLLDDYLYGHDLLDLLEDFPYEWKPTKLVEILRQLPPRLYSISSSQDYVGEEVHATVSVVRYERRKRLREGACSSHLADVIEIDDQVPIYIEKNPAFKLPANGSKIIMVGAGTGIAPYRAFLQHRESNGLKGKSWLFFGDRRFQSDFLYQIEWQKYLQNKQLEKMEVAFSRDQDEKVYIQHKLLENKEEVFKWIEEGAYFYLCGDMKFMAKDVNKTLLEIIKNQGGISEEKAAEYIKKLKREKRFQSDVY